MDCLPASVPHKGTADFPDARDFAVTFDSRPALAVQPKLDLAKALLECE